MYQNHPIPAENPILSAPEMEKNPNWDRPIRYNPGALLQMVGDFDDS